LFANFIIQQIIKMSGTGTGRGSGRAHFRSKSGCCICGTKSSSSRFTASERYAEHFGNCFGEGATDRSGDLCNACVLCVKRWLSRGKEIGRFKQVFLSSTSPVRLSITMNITY
uniref:SIN3-HDAC complex associated factor n=1 Tax=Rodentolepis nana TaxID=102285 RepID=A0A0R3TMS1_RODNA